MHDFLRKVFENLSQAAHIKIGDKTSSRILGSIVVFVLIGPMGWSGGIKWGQADDGTLKIVTNAGGQTLGYSTNSGVTLVYDDRYAFKDLNKNGELDKYEAWRLSAKERTKDLAKKMSIEQIAGVMLYSGHQSIPADGRRRSGGTYNGKPFSESGTKPSDLSDQQIQFLTDDNLQHVLITRVESPEVAAGWNNNTQALVEGLGLGIPINTSSNLRHRTVAEEEYNAGAGGYISMWPRAIRFAATFDPELVRQFGEIASIEYRALRNIYSPFSPD